MGLPEAEVKALKPIWVFVQQVTQIGCGLMSCRNRQEHVNSFHCDRSFSGFAIAHDQAVSFRPRWRFALFG
jgi:hypothetical protein